MRAKDSCKAFYEMLVDAVHEMMMMITYTASVGLASIIKKQLYKLVN